MAEMFDEYTGAGPSAFDLMGAPADEQLGRVVDPELLRRELAGGGFRGERGGRESWQGLLGVGLDKMTPAAIRLAVRQTQAAETRIFFESRAKMKPHPYLAGQMLSQLRSLESVFAHKFHPEQMKQVLSPLWYEQHAKVTMLTDQIVFVRERMAKVGSLNAQIVALEKAIGVGSMSPPEETEAWGALAVLREDLVRTIQFEDPETLLAGFQAELDQEEAYLARLEKEEFKPPENWCLAKLEKAEREMVDIDRQIEQVNDGYREAKKILKLKEPIDETVLRKFQDQTEQLREDVLARLVQLETSGEIPSYDRRQIEAERRKLSRQGNLTPSQESRLDQLETILVIDGEIELLRNFKKDVIALKESGLPVGPREQATGKGGVDREKIERDAEIIEEIFGIRKAKLLQPDIYINLLDDQVAQLQGGRGEIIEEFQEIFMKEGRQAARIKYSGGNLNVEIEALERLETRTREQSEKLRLLKQLESSRKEMTALAVLQAYPGEAEQLTGEKKTTQRLIKDLKKQYDQLLLAIRDAQKEIEAVAILREIFDQMLSVGTESAKETRDRFVSYWGKYQDMITYFDMTHLKESRPGAPAMGKLIDRAFDAWFQIATERARDEKGKIDNIFGTPAQPPMLNRAMRYVISEAMGVRLADRPETNADLMEILGLEKAADLRTLSSEMVSARIDQAAITEDTRAAVIWDSVRRVMEKAESTDNPSQLLKQILAETQKFYEIPQTVDDLEAMKHLDFADAAVAAYYANMIFRSMRLDALFCFTTGKELKLDDFLVQFCGVPAPEVYRKKGEEVPLKKSTEFGGVNADFATIMRWWLRNTGEAKSDYRQGFRALVGKMPDLAASVFEMMTLTREVEKMKDLGDIINLSKEQIAWFQELLSNKQKGSYLTPREIIYGLRLMSEDVAGGEEKAVLDLLLPVSSGEMARLQEKLGDLQDRGSLRTEDRELLEEYFDERTKSGRREELREVVGEKLAVKRQEGIAAEELVYELFGSDYMETVLIGDLPGLTATSLEGFQKALGRRDSLSGEEIMDLLNAPADTQRISFYDLYKGWEEDGEKKRLQLSGLPWLGGDPKFMRQFDQAFAYFRKDLDRRGNLRRWGVSKEPRLDSPRIPAGLQWFYSLKIFEWITTSEPDKLVVGWYDNPMWWLDMAKGMDLGPRIEFSAKGLSEETGYQMERLLKINLIGGTMAEITTIGFWKDFREDVFLRRRMPLGRGRKATKNVLGAMSDWKSIGKDILTWATGRTRLSEERIKQAGEQTSSDYLANFSLYVLDPAADAGFLSGLTTVKDFPEELKREKWNSIDHREIERLEELETRNQLQDEKLRRLKNERTSEESRIRGIMLEQERDAIIAVMTTQEAFLPSEINEFLEAKGLSPLFTQAQLKEIEKAEIYGYPGVV